MTTTFSARAVARSIPNMAAKGLTSLERPNSVLAVVMASTVMTAVCGFIIVSNVIDSRIALALAANQTAAGPAPTPERVYPGVEPFDTTISVVIDSAPVGRTAPQIAAVTTAPTIGVPAVAGIAQPVTVIAGRPPVMPLERPAGAPATEIVIIARNMTADRAAALPRPIARPEGTTSPAWPDQDTGPQTSVLLAAASPRPSERPAEIVTRAAAFAEIGGIELARAEAPGANGGIGESPRPSIFSGGGNGECSPRLARAIPRRPGNASGGASVMANVGNGSGNSRDDRLVQQALAGNVPSHVRDLRPVTLNGTVGGRSVEVTICVTPDYLAVGSDSDYVRVPLGLPGALRVADAFDMMLPTTTMVDAIYQQADVRVAPAPMTPGSSMSSTSYFVRHNETINGQFARAGARDGMLVAGHKKDLVLANRLSRNPGRVAIYGWHRTNGRAIQSLSTVHGQYYADYSHGIRLVSQTAYVNGNAVDLSELLTDERYAGFLNSDGALSGATVRLASL